MSRYEITWPCCGGTTITDAYEPSECPFCSSAGRVRSEAVALAGRAPVALVDERTSGDCFENAIRKFGVVAACEWFGHAPNSDFTKETTKLLDERVANSGRRSA